MISIVRVSNTFTPVNARRIQFVKEIFRENFSLVADYAEKIPGLINEPVEHRYRSILLVCERRLANPVGFSLFMVFPEPKIALLDFLAVKRGIRGSGIGTSLYDATRDYAKGLGYRGLYLEVLPDDPAVVADKAILEENRKRLAFYEHYHLTPIAGTRYETPIGKGAAPHLLFDLLGREAPLGREEARRAVSLILSSKYGKLLPPDYIPTVVASFRDDPVRFREPRYSRRTASTLSHRPYRFQKKFLAVSSTRHTIHHIHERGYVERPARVQSILSGIGNTGLFEQEAPEHFGEEPIRKVHDGAFVDYLKRVCTTLDPEIPVYPYVFPIRRPERPPKELALRAGYFCIDTFTPLDANAYAAARAAVDVSLTAARRLLDRGFPLAYAICRPPGHHAQRRAYGGFCYFNNAAVAAEFLSRQGSVAVLDIDFHHGNGTQDIFYRRKDVLTLSIHGHPNIAYPYFSGFSDETGEGEGLGFNHNYPLPEEAGEEAYLAKFEGALRRLHAFRPSFLVVSIGFDIMKGDPTGSFGLLPASLRKIGFGLGGLNLPTLVVQEGGYNGRNLARGSVAFFSGFAGALDQGRTIANHGILLTNPAPNATSRSHPPPE